MIKVMNKSKRLVFVRSGGIGDFLLTIPLLCKVHKIYEEIILFSKREYLFLVTELFPSMTKYDLNYDYAMIFQYAKDSDLISFWNDAEWRNQLTASGVNHFETLKSRPTEEPHVVTQMFQTLGWEFPVEELHFAWLGDSWKMKNQTLWIHPGSGSKKKMPKFLFSKKKLKHGCQRIFKIK